MKTYIKRAISDKILEASKYFKAIVINGPRQTGKTTLCRNLFPEYNYYNLEMISTQEILRKDPVSFMDRCGEKVIIDEVQNYPEILSYIQVAVDMQPERQFILTGSNNFSLMESVTQSLAGRAALFTLLPFSLLEVKEYADQNSIEDILINGLYPGAVSDGIPHNLFYQNYISTYVERDVRKLYNLRQLDTFVIFLKLCASRIGTELNLTSLATEIGVSTNTIKEWISVLKASYIIFTLPPYYSNIGKRLTKTPKIYFYDTGLAASLLEIEDDETLYTSISKGPLFENLAILEFLKARYNNGLQSNIYYYRERSGKEIDVVQENGGFLNLYEIKASKTYKSEFDKNMRQLKDLLGEKVKDTGVIYDGESIPPTAINIRNI